LYAEIWASPCGSPDTPWAWRPVRVARTGSQPAGGGLDELDPWNRTPLL